jgi:hypothetical protein
MGRFLTVTNDRGGSKRTASAGIGEHTERKKIEIEGGEGGSNRGLLLISRLPFAYRYSLI